MTLAELVPMSSWCSWLSFGGYGTVEPPPPLSRALLQSGDDRTSNAIIAAFKGDGAFQGLSSAAAEKADFRFLRFRPPLLEREGSAAPALPHIRLDRALQFLIGDRLQ